MTSNSSDNSGPSSIEASAPTTPIVKDEPLEKFPRTDKGRYCCDRQSYLNVAIRELHRIWVTKLKPSIKRKKKKLTSPVYFNE